ncbi:hypothetical protein C8R44DRAFT_189561 [Mycena epipterygia]|nr:hypothetical protein C8R44DRAFT_189561 [Mycena epipterygia]
MEIETEPQSRPERVQELWFEDGNLVIQAENRQFRLYRGILAAHSPVFHDMLVFPQKPDPEIVEGCQLLRLSDPASEVTVFLKAIFDHNFFMPFPAPTEFDIVVGCLRLGNKYRVDSLRRRALVHLSSGYRTTLAETDSVVEFHDDPGPSREIKSWRNPGTPNFRVCAIQIAREVDALWVLPFAFYKVSAAFSPIGTDMYQGAAYSSLSASLSIQDQQFFFMGHTSQITANAHLLRFLSYPRSVDIEGCESPTLCDGERCRAVESARDMICQYPSIPLDIWEWNCDWENFRVCTACLTALRDTHQNARQAFWDKLPEMYGLPPWEELKKMKEAAIGNEFTAF